MNWWKKLKGKVRFLEPLAKHTTFKIGGPAEFFIEPEDIADLKLLLNLVKRYKIPVFLIGGGSNILINDKGIRGAVLHLNSPYFKRFIFKNNRLEAGSGVMLSRMVLKTYKRGLSGVEFLSGIPGTLGGALVMNAGAWGRNIGDLVEEVNVMDYNGNIKSLGKKKIKFGYRQSSLEKFVILSACLKLTKKSKEKIKQNLKQYLKARHNSQDTTFSNAGCIFKNPFGESAGRLIDICGLKGRRIGDACISGKHANFIVNMGHGKAEDVLRLMNLIKKKVKNKFHINLEPEIKIWHQKT